MNEPIVIRVPSGEPEEVVQRIAKAAEVAARHRLGLLSPQTPAAGTENPCEAEGCTFLGQEQAGGELWDVYDCAGEIVSYKA